MPGEELLLCVTAGFAAACGWMAHKMGYKIVKDDDKTPTGDAPSSDEPPAGAAEPHPSGTKA